MINNSIQKESFWVCDLECNAKDVDKVTTIWCFCAKKVGENHWFISVPHDDNTFLIEQGLRAGAAAYHESLNCESNLIFHNGIAFDIPVIEKICGFKPKNKIIDTLIWSRINNPDLEGGHSLEAWGKRLGHHKVHHDEWDRYSEEMLHRCQEDVRITEELYLKLCEGIKK